VTGDHDTITLADAAKHFRFSVYTLRSEADRGRLAIYKIGNKYYTTPADVRKMVEQCRVEQKVPVSIYTRIAKSGSSETDRQFAALAAANEIALELKSGSRNTSAKSTNRNHRTRP
jgi:hypothetical protein